MSSRYYRRNFIPGYFYHLYNRGAFKKHIYLDEEDYNTFTDIFSYYLKFPSNKPYSESELNTSKEVPHLPKLSFCMGAYCLMPNHFHFIVKQIHEPQLGTSIVNFMKRITITYSMYHKKKYKRSGVLFESKYKNVLVNDDSQLLHLSRYIHLNPIEMIRGSVPPHQYEHSSYKYYLDYNATPSWINKDHIMNFFSSNPAQYQAFVEEKPYKYGLTEKTIIE